MKSVVAYWSSIWLVAATALIAQEKTTAPEKPQPEPHRWDVTSSPEEKSIAKENGKIQLLPKIDLPEFVITGVASIDVPNVEKLSAEEAAPMKLDARRIVFAGERERETYELTLGQKQLLHVVNALGFSGKAIASWGTYHTPTAGLWIGQVSREYHYLIDGEYFITQGFAPYTNRSRGDIGLEGGINLHSGWSPLNNSRLTGIGKYGSQTYRFYGSSTPSLTRTASQVSFQTDLSASPESPIDYDLSLGYKQLVLTDSSLETTQKEFDAAWESRVPVGESAIIGKVQFSTSSVTSPATRDYPFLNFSIGSSRLWWGDFFVQAAAHFYWTKGDVGQSLTRVYPHISTGFRLSKKTTMLASYQGSVRYNTLSALIDAHPYLSSVSVLRQSNVPADIFGAVETNWDAVWRTRFSARYQSVEDYPLYRNIGALGIWDLFYGGTTTISTYAADLFAKFRPNGYFGLTVAVRSTKNSVTQDRIPYLSDFEISALFSYTLTFGLNVAPSLSFVDRRNVDLVSGAKLPEFWIVGLKTEYDLIEPLKLFVEVHNVTDRKYEQWRGYLASPFVLTGGLSYRW